MDNKKAKVTNFTPLHQPIHAIVDGQPVRLIAFGDVEGNSPSYLTCDNEGRSKWASLDNVQIIDTNFLPMSAEALHHLHPVGAGGRSNR
jgi:hypothetical protein